MWLATGLKPNLVAFAAGSLGAVAVFLVFYFGKMLRESGERPPGQRGSDVFLAVLGAITLIITGTPLWMAAGVVGILVMHVGRFLIRLLHFA